MVEGLRVPLFVLIGTFALWATPAMSSPPPPPPPWVWDASGPLTDATLKDWARIDALFADDITVTVNGHRLSRGKANWRQEWLRQKTSYVGRILGYSMGWKDSGSLLIFDEYGTADHKISPLQVSDPRPSTRSTLYIFGPDHLVHSIEIANVDAFFMTPRK